MTVVVEDGLGSGELMIETSRYIVREKEVFGEKAVHGQVLARLSPWISLSADQRFKP
jgi:hypothetical protein